MTPEILYRRQRKRPPPRVGKGHPESKEPGTVAAAGCSQAFLVGSRSLPVGKSSLKYWFFSNMFLACSLNCLFGLWCLAALLPQWGRGELGWGEVRWAGAAGGCWWTGPEEGPGDVSRHVCKPQPGLPSALRNGNAAFLHLPRATAPAAALAARGRAGPSAPSPTRVTAALCCWSSSPTASRPTSHVAGNVCYGFKSIDRSPQLPEFLFKPRKPHLRGGQGDAEGATSTIGKLGNTRLKLPGPSSAVPLPASPSLQFVTRARPPFSGG